MTFLSCVSSVTNPVCPPPPPNPSWLIVSLSGTDISGLPHHTQGSLLRFSHPHTPAVPKFIEYCTLLVVMHTPPMGQLNASRVRKEEKIVQVKYSVEIVLFHTQDMASKCNKRKYFK